LPDQVTGLALHPDGIGLVWVVEFEHVLNASDLAQGTCKHLHGILLLLAPLLLLTLGLLLLALLLLALPLLLITLRHLDLLATCRLLYLEELGPLPATPRLYPIYIEVRHGDYVREVRPSLLTALMGHDRRVTRCSVEIRDYGIQ
jgi:hypothetical protein